MLRESAPNTWMYGGILVDFEWASTRGKVKLWSGDEAEVQRGDTVTMLWTSGVVHAVEVKRPALTAAHPAP